MTSVEKVAVVGRLRTRMTVFLLDESELSIFQMIFQSLANPISSSTSFERTERS